MVRIVAGTARGRKLEAPEGLDTRPTLDRVKEAAFGSLQFAVPGSRVLDLFSGSGNLGLEAVSRGASFAVLNDFDPNCTAIISKNASTLGMGENVRILCEDFRNAIFRLKTEGQCFDIVFLDPPYRSGFGEEACRLLFSNGMIAKNGTVVLEYSTDLPPKLDESLMRIRKTKRCGSCSFSFVEREDET